MLAIVFETNTDAKITPSNATELSLNEVIPLEIKKKIIIGKIASSNSFSKEERVYKPDIVATDKNGPTTTALTSAAIKYVCNENDFFILNTLVFIMKKFSRWYHSPLKMARNGIFCLF